MEEGHWPSPTAARPSNRGWTINAAQAPALSAYRDERSVGCRNTIYRENDGKVPIGRVVGNLGHNLIESGAAGSYACIEKVGGRHEDATNGDANAARHAGNLAGYLARLKRGVRWAKTGHKETDELSWRGCPIVRGK